MRLTTGMMVSTWFFGSVAIPSCPAAKLKIAWAAKTGRSRPQDGLSDNADRLATRREVGRAGRARLRGAE